MSLSNNINLALQTTDIPPHLRSYLRGMDLKAMVLTCQTWWRVFAPFLWEALAIVNPDKEEDSAKTIFRNGQVVKRLLLSIQRSTHFIQQIIQSCPNINILKLRLEESHSN